MPNSNTQLHANTLFHFTPKLEFLKSIIKNGFYPRYSYEKFFGGLDGLRDYIRNTLGEEYVNHELAIENIGIPMVCFCDIRLSRIRNQVNSYGYYSIGLEKEWKNQAELSPVFYLDTKNSATYHLINSLVGIGVIMLDKTYPEDSYIRNLKANLLDLGSFIKQYEGYKWNPTSYEYDDTLIKFYNEREWRYVPPIQILREQGKKGLPPAFLVAKFFEKREILNELNQGLQNRFQLKFSPYNVKYIIVKENSEVEDLIEFIDSIEDYTEIEKKILHAKLLSMEQVFEDF